MSISTAGEKYALSSNGYRRTSGQLVRSLPMSKPKKKPIRPSMDDLMNQIYEWREQATAELRRYERLEKARENAKRIFDI